MMIVATFLIFVGAMALLAGAIALNGGPFSGCRSADCHCSAAKRRACGRARLRSDVE
jgi:hypothetical protein